MRAFIRSESGPASEVRISSPAMQQAAGDAATDVFRKNHLRRPVDLKQSGFYSDRSRAFRPVGGIGHLARRPISRRQASGRMFRDRSVRMDFQ